MFYQTIQSCFIKQYNQDTYLDFDLGDLDDLVQVGQIDQDASIKFIQQGFEAPSRLNVLLPPCWNLLSALLPGESLGMLHLPVQLRQFVELRVRSHALGEG